MGLKEKFTFVQKSTVFKWTLVAVLALIGALILFYGYKTCLRYAPVKGKGVEVTATASRIEETLDSENMEEYELFVDYEYQGKAYTVYYKTYGTYAKAAAVDTVKLVINPDNPDEKMETLKSNMILSIIFGLLFMATAVAATGIRQNEDQIVAHGINRETVKIELIEQIRHRRGAAWLMTMGAGVIITWLLFSSALSLLLPAAGLVILVFGVRKLMKDLKALKDLKNDKFRICQEFFLRRYEDSDSESTSYFVEYGHDDIVLIISVTEEEYLNAGAGDSAYSIFLDGQSETVSCYRKTVSGWQRCSFSVPQRKGH